MCLRAIKDPSEKAGNIHVCSNRSGMQNGVRYLDAIELFFIKNIASFSFFRWFDALVFSIVLRHDPIFLISLSFFVGGQTAKLNKLHVFRL